MRFGSDFDENLIKTCKNLEHLTIKKPRIQKNINTMLNGLVKLQVFDYSEILIDREYQNFSFNLKLDFLTHLSLRIIIIPDTVLVSLPSK